MKFLYIAHIPFVLLFVAFAAVFVCANWRGQKSR
jgi:hypothetical protein